MHYLYLDESGDLGFDFVNRKPSKYFTICIVVCPNKQSKSNIEKAVKRTLRNKINYKSKKHRLVQELKGVSTTLTVKKYFYKQLKDTDFAIYALTLNKIRVFEELVNRKPRVYNWISRLLLENIELRKIEDRISFTLDKSKGSRGIKEFNSYIRNHLESEIKPNVPLDIYHKDSKDIYCLQAADLFAWGIRRQYEKRDEEWYTIFKSKVLFDDVYFP